MLRAGTGRRFTHLSGGNGAILGAPFSLDFQNGIYWGNGLSGPISLFLSVARNSIGTDLVSTSPSGFAYTTFATNTLRVGSNGLLIEEPRHNSFVNSATPVTQTITTVTTGPHVLWVNGAGSATSAANTAIGTGFGTATNGTPNIFTIATTGTVNITVTGALNTAQVELGAFPTSFIPTSAAQVTRNADNVSIIGTLLSAIQGTSGSIILNQGGMPSSGYPLSGVSGNNIPLFYSTNTVVGTGNNAGQFLTANFGSGGFATGAKLGVSWGNGRALVANNGTVVTDANAFSTNATGFLGSNHGTSNYTNGFIQKLMVWRTQIDSGSLKGFTA